MSRQFTFSQTPFIKRSRSRFDLSYNLKGSTEVGRLIPFYDQEVFPGDGLRCNSKIVVRLQGEYLKVPFDTIFADVYYFFVPWRIVYDGFEGVFGKPSPNSWIEDDLNEIPTFLFDNSFTSISKHSIADYFGLPLRASGSGTPTVSVLPFRAYAKIYDEWFRDENLIDPINISIGDHTDNEFFGDGEFSSNYYCGMCAQVSKVHDYFSSCLPAPQKGEAVSVFGNVNSFYPLKTNPSGTSSLGGNLLISNGNSIASGSSLALNAFNAGSSMSSQLTVGTSVGGAASPSPVLSTNAGVDLTSVGLINVNDLRFAFQTQKFLERDARGGSRYQEYLAAHWGIMATDSRLQRPEYLGGRRIPLSAQQVVQTSSTSDEPSQLGSLGAFSLSVDSARFNKSFTEHGIVIGVMALRYYHTYSQGIPRWFRRKSRYDFYDPVFANIGEQPVYQEEIFYNPATSRDEGVPGGSTPNVFGYNEAWADLRYRPNRLVGDMHVRDSDGTTILPGALWTFGDDYSNGPVLGQEWITENPKFFQRTTTLGDSSTLDSFIFDVYHSVTGYRELPTYGLPSLIDHN
ncbi:major capsid protein [Dipodfec virus UOA04_Rod_1027]|nr:major capsid protein [Dipodfec virus UOA04_Rod_1027]